MIDIGKNSTGRLFMDLMISGYSARMSRTLTHQKISPKSTMYFQNTPMENHGPI
jgi:hypothetical protein